VFIKNAIKFILLKKKFALLFSQISPLKPKNEKTPNFPPNFFLVLSSKSTNFEDQMATISAFSTPLHLFSKTHFKSPKNLFFYPNSIHFQTKVSTFSSNNLTLSFKNSKTLYGTWKLKSAEEEETAVVEQEREETTVAEQESVSVPVSPSDTLRMYFQIPAQDLTMRRLRGYEIKFC
ncbi:hypothetical protein E1A91_D05G290100v1, partial [Gossypium mustelinum]